jgi:hypothetical protein
MFVSIVSLLAVRSNEQYKSMEKNIISKIAVVSIFLICFMNNVNAQADLDYQYVNGHQKAKIEVQSEDQSLKLDGVTKVILQLENIAPKTVTLSAPNMKMLMQENTENSLVLEITAQSEFVKDGKYSIHASGKTDGVIWSHKFVIAVK